MPRARLTALLQEEIPSRGAAEASQHENWYVAYRAHLKRKQEIISSHNLEERGELLVQGKAELDACREKCREEEAREAEVREREQMREILHARLSDMRSEKFKVAEDQLAAERALQLEEQQLQAARKAARDRENEQKKALIREYKWKRQEMENNRKIQEEAEQRRAQELRIQQINDERSNVDRRKAAYEQKLAERRKKEVRLKGIFTLCGFIILFQEEYLQNEERKIELLVHLASQVI